MIVKQKEEKPISVDETMDLLFKKISANRQKDVRQAFNEEDALKAIWREKQMGDYKGKGKAKWRRVARIHPLIYNAALKLYGPNVFKDKDSFKELMKRPEMQSFLTVPITEL